jgi:ribosomal subunit interface protein
MKIKIQAINTDLTPTQREVVNTKLALKLDQLVTQTEEDLKLLHVKLEQRSDWGIKVMANLKLADKDFHAEAREDKLTTALIEVREELERQIKEFKQKTRAY